MGKLLGRRNLENLLIFGLKVNKSDLYPHALIQKGFAGWSDYEHTGELDVLYRIAETNTCRTCFDVGANDGTYSLMLKRVFPDANVFAFEPVPDTYAVAVKNLSGTTQVTLINKALSDYTGQIQLYTDASDHNNQISSSFATGMKEFYQVKDLQNVLADVTTADGYCKETGIESIDFIKIDVEGAELSVLLGCKDLLARQRIRFIQFEFNDFNISSRTYMKDFYELLHDFIFYRIVKGRCLRLGNYSTDHEIFRYQNILAVHSSVAFNG